MRTYFRNIKHVTSLMAFIVALLTGMSFATVSNAAAVPGNPVISNPAAVNAAVPPMVPMVPRVIKAASPAVNPAPAAKSDVVVVRPFGFGFNQFGFGFNQFGFGVRPFGFGVRPFGFGFNPFFDVDFDFID
jgi:hypothetical protein